METKLSVTLQDLSHLQLFHGPYFQQSAPWLYDMEVSINTTMEVLVLKHDIYLNLAYHFLGLLKQ